MAVAIGVLVCLWTIRVAGTFAVSRLLVKYALATRSLEVAQKANQLSPTDAQGHFAEAALLSYVNRPAESAVALQRAVALRPADYSLWLQLGLLRDQLGETDTALAAFNEAVRLAPSYAQPRWLRGNFLLRAGQYNSAFKDLSEAASSNPELLSAFEMWKVAQNDVAGNERLTPEIYDGGFEGPLTFDAVGFQWHVPRIVKGVTLSLDSSQPHSGSRNLRIDFLGDSNPGSELVSQVLLVEPSRRYQINFASRSREVVTGGPPLVVVTETKGDRKRLGQSAPLDEGIGTGNWRPYSFEFTSGATTRAVSVSVQRQNCSTSPCPIFGSISLDSFSVAKLK